MKALLCLLEAESVSLFPELASKLDELARLGCAGQLVWRSIGGEDLNIPVKAFAIKQVLGLSYAKYNEAPLSSRFGQMNMAFLSPEKTCFAHIQCHKLSVVEHIADSHSPEDLLRLVESIIVPGGEKKVEKEGACDILLVHLPLTPEQDSEVRSRNAAFMCDVLDLILQRKPDGIYTSVILTAPLNAYDPRSSEQSREDSESYRPIQSYQLFEDSIVSTSTFTPASAFYYMPDVTRTDRVERFSHEECARKGANHRILMDQYLSEIAFKLGFTPKYGA